MRASGRPACWRLAGSCLPAGGGMGLLSVGLRPGFCSRLCGSATGGKQHGSETELTSLLPGHPTDIGSEKTGTDASAYPMRAVLPAFWRHFRPFLAASARGKMLSLMTLALCLCSAGLSIWISYVSRDFQSALSDKNQEGFYSGIAKFVGVILIAIPLDSSFGYVQAHLALSWRIWLTERLLGQYFADEAFYRLSRPALQAIDPVASAGKASFQAAAAAAEPVALDNPDQRICQDVASFTASSLGLLVLLFEKSLNLLGFAGVLWSISPKLVFFLIAYALAGSFLSLRVFGKPIISSNAAMLRQEADLRYSLLRVRENAEAIAFYRAGHAERTVVLRRLALLLGTRSTLIWWQRCLTIFQVRHT